MKRIATYVAIAVLAMFAVGGLVGGTVAIRMVDSNLTAQQITFGPDTSRSGQQVTNGFDAYRFQQVIDGHVKAALKPAGFTTFEQVSAAARASATAANPAGDPKLDGLRRTSLDGQLLRSSLFSSFAWWSLGWVGVGLGVAFGLLAGCAFLVTRRSPQTLFFPAPQSTVGTVSV